jgi:hypothetical protein
MQANLFNHAKKYREEKSEHINSTDELFEFFRRKDPDFAYAHWCHGGKNESGTFFP